MKTQIRTHMIPGVLFIAASLVNVVGHVIGVDWMPTFTKPALMPLLLLASLLAMGEYRTDKLRPVPALLVFALLFHCAGDVLLMLPDDKFFIFGLAAFLVGHFFYLAIICRGLKRVTFPEAVVGVGLPLVAAPFVALPFGLEGFMKIAVIVYGFTLLCYLGLGCAGMMQRHRDYRLFVIGGALFILSDSLLAVDAFLNIDFPLRHAAVMATYTTAEFFLALGACKVVPAQR